MAKLSISRAWDETRGVLRRDGKLVTSVALALIALPQAIAAMVAPPPILSDAEPPSWLPLLTLLVALIGLVGQLAIIRLALGPATSVRESIARGLKRLLPTFLALLLFGIGLMILILPLLLLLISPEEMQAVTRGDQSPGAARAMLIALLVVVLIGARFQMMMPIAAAENVGPLRILKGSWASTKGHYWRLLAFLLIVLGVAVVVVLFVGQMMGGILARMLFGDIEPFTVAALVAGLISALVQAVFSAVTSVMLARIYVQLTGADQVEASVPSSGT